MIAVVLETATEDEEQTAERLRALGFQQKTVWVKRDTENVITTLRTLGVAQFMVGTYWGRGPE